MTLLTVDGVRVRARVEDLGGRPAVVLVHMAGGSGTSWGPVAGLLGRRAFVVAPDLPGHGQSQPAAPVPCPALSRPGVSALIESHAGWVLRLLDALGLERAVLAGHSMGGCVALVCALGAPARVAGLALLCTSARLSLAAGMRALMAENYDAFIAQFSPSALPQGAGSAAAGRARAIFPQADRATVLADFASVDGFDVLGAVGALRMPTAVIAGDMDVLTPPAHSERLAAAIPGATLTVVPAAGHLLPREQPAVVAQAIGGLWERAAADVR